MSSFLHSPNQQTDLSTEACKKHKQTDLYEILGVSRDATQEMIKEKYTELILLHHPDKGGDPQQFRDLQVAYKILSNPKNRDIYTKSLSSTFTDITGEYRDPVTGQYKDIGYEISLDDFTRAETDEDKEARKAEFMKKFDDSRTNDEKKLITTMQKSYQQDPNLSFEELVKRRQQAREKEDEDLEIPLIEGLDPSKRGETFNDLFNQIFEANRQNQARGLEPVDSIAGVGQMGLAPLDSNYGHGSLFSNDPWMSFQTAQDFQTYQQPQNVDIRKYDPTVNVTRTRDNNPEDLMATLEERLKAHHLNFRELTDYVDKAITSGTFKFAIDPEHDDRNKPLSELNMLGGQDLIQTLDPPCKQ
jgi:curved DNA-binding protein CbpA